MDASILSLLIFVAVFAVVVFVHELGHFLAARLFNLRTGEGDFWGLVHQPFSEKQLTKDTVRALVDTVRRGGARNMPEFALALKACDPRSDDAEERLRFFKFKNFLYKTVRV